ncbi:zf-ccch type zinc finger protein [Moniliophthora roreri]|uniref:C3H1-type domain-containing protein n=1 Tax=Moniliophthora roreri TaxID=221103 RepID=A0A0W0FBP0_MONRR|nr:zf-ccch type zinc finger protein [Moniliophthora roreri]
MPTVDSERDRAKDKDRERDHGTEDSRERAGSKQAKPSSSSSKSKDLSHVPCKFFKVGSCTAGSSCPFSHAVLEPGAQKDVCAWFVKGNCKFGHKCALAHVLPGQSMSMDRKNKKAAQQAAAAAGGGKGAEGGKKSGSSKRENAGRPPITMSLKSSISPSAPAPAIKDTDFASFGVLDETSKLPSAPAQGKPASPPPQPLASEETPTTPAKPVSPSLPVSSPRDKDPGRSPAKKPAIDFGPIGSPPRVGIATSPHAHPHPISRLNGVSPGTSPSSRSNTNGTPTNNNFLSTSPFSAPGTQSVFLNYPERGGMAASLGTGLLNSNPRWATNHTPSAPAHKQVFDLDDEPRTGAEDDLEDFLPSSLTDLLTPEERSRRMSRSNSGQGPNGGGGIEPPMLSPTRRAALGVPTTAAAAGHGNNDGAHRYSRSVPATSLLGDISSIWSNTNPAQASPHVGSPLAAGLPSSPGRALGNGTPSSFGAGSPPAFSITPSNASAAFLPGVHAAYYKSKQTQDLGRGVRNVSSPLYGASSGAGAGAGTGAGAGGAGAGTGTLQSSLAAATARLGGGSGYGTPTGTSNGFGDMNIGGGTGIGLGLGVGVGVGVGVGGQGDVHPHRPNLLSSNSSQAFSSHHHLAHADDPQLALSPGSRALQAHAPGQSLPQGLAAGYSRIHAMPSVGSPGSIGVGGGGYSVSPGATGAFNIGPYGSNAAYARESMGRGETEWSGFGSFTPNNVATPPGLGHLHPVPQQTDDTTSKMSYAKAAKGPVGVGVKSPLSKPVSGGGDDDDLFTLDA